ncbi:MAG: hypothetical protein KDK25_02425 [Leptospiraceae bacterium]|nr:hypothetical protein [Leptospiraceae bacterium]
MVPFVQSSGRSGILPFFDSGDSHRRPGRASIASNLLLSIVLLMTAANCTFAGSGPAPHHPSSHPWLVHPEEAASRIEESILLDARFYGNYISAHIAGAAHISWKDFSRSNEERGLLLPEAELRARLSEMEIQGSSLVFVYGGAREGWGEEGRIVWMLREAGIRRSYLVDGGYRSLLPYLEASVGPIKGDYARKSPDTSEVQDARDAKEPGIPEQGEGPAQAKGPTNAESAESMGPGPHYSISREELARRYTDDDIAIIDVREMREYRGETPYGESRGGHIPGATHIYFQDFLDQRGYSLSKDQIQQLLADHGIRENQLIVPYCTGGVRSAMVTAILRHHGFRASNFAGSMWYWSAGNARMYPLEKEP